MTQEIARGVYSVGVLNPNMRTFDIIMKTDFGTSYNAYIVRGENKTALVETAHLKYFDALIENISQVCAPESIDYLIMNHNEPDHSGAIAKLLELNPNLEVITSKAGSIYLKNITNSQHLKVRAVADGEELDLGGRSLRFINAPFLHWPDSMFTYDTASKVLFSCDMFGCHYCEPRVFDKNVVYKEKYDTALKGYFDAIFGPFKPYVLKGMEKIKDLDVAFAATSHGPVLSKDVFLPEVMEKYRQWATPQQHTEKQIPVFYVSAYGNTKLLAQEIKKGILSVLPQAEVTCYDIIKHDMGTLAAVLNSSDAFGIGSPTINKDAVAPVWQLLSHIDAINIQKRPAFLFGSYGWSGEAVPALQSRLEMLKVNLAQPFKVVFVPSAEDLQKAYEYGRSFAENL